jgi:hypothetical protein
MDREGYKGRNEKDKDYKDKKKERKRSPKWARFQPTFSGLHPLKELSKRFLAVGRRLSLNHGIRALSRTHSRVTLQRICWSV